MLQRGSILVSQVTPKAQFPRADFRAKLVLLSVLGLRRNLLGKERKNLCKISLQWRDLLFGVQTRGSNIQPGSSTFCPSLVPRISASFGLCLTTSHQPEVTSGLLRRSPVGGVQCFHAAAFSQVVLFSSYHMSLLPWSWKSTIGARTKEQLTHGCSSEFCLQAPFYIELPWFGHLRICGDPTRFLSQPFFFSCGVPLICREFSVVEKMFICSKAPFALVREAEKGRKKRKSSYSNPSCPQTQC